MSPALLKNSRKEKAMIEKIGIPAMLEQTAEEATELAQALLKAARVIRAENPTPITRDKASAMVTEEYSDLIACTRDLGLQYDEELEDRKHARFEERWQNRRQNE